MTQWYTRMRFAGHCGRSFMRRVYVCKCFTIEILIPFFFFLFFFSFLFFSFSLPFFPELIYCDQRYWSALCSVRSTCVIWQTYIIIYIYIYISTYLGIYKRGYNERTVCNATQSASDHALCTTLDEHTLHAIHSALTLSGQGLELCWRVLALLDDVIIHTPHVLFCDGWEGHVTTCSIRTVYVHGWKRTTHVQYAGPKPYPTGF